MRKTIAFHLPNSAVRLPSSPQHPSTAAEFGSPYTCAAPPSDGMSSSPWASMRWKNNYS
uniref:Uncharacterized protein n=1 Tax=Arundo donax TaxID=35708 RepID=A0A0A8YN00_ARUDO